MGNSSFNYALIRITVMQILRGIGFDRCSPTIIDILADLYIRHLQLLTAECRSLCESCGREDIEIQDITQALQNIGMIKPVNTLDIYEQYDTQNKGVQKFLYWVVGNIPENARLVSKPTAELLNQNKLKANPVIPEYINSLNSSSVLDQTTQTQEVSQDEILDEDWLKYLVKKSSKLGHEERFKNTILHSGSEHAASDFTVVGPTPKELEQRLPYNLKKPTGIDLLEEDDDTDLRMPSEIDHSGFTNSTY